jgi:hypothetical protein
MDVLKTMIFQVRTKVKDLAVRQFHEHEIIAALNEGKNECVKLIRQADENYFEGTASATISSTTVPHYSQITLPVDCAEIRDIKITTSGMEDVNFIKLSQSDQRFKNALLDGGSFAGGMSTFYWDFWGDSIILAPGSDTELTCKLHYIKLVPDMYMPDSYPQGIPIEDYDFIVTWAICECMRSNKDDRLNQYLDKLSFQKDSVVASVNSRQAKEPEFVVGFMEEEFW